MYDWIKKIINDEVLKYSANIVGCYLFGSRLYQTHTEESDYDYVVIIDKEGEFYYQYESEKLDIHFMTIEYYKKALNKCDIMALECFYQDTPILKYEIEFTPRLHKLRESISATVSNSWVKAKKKILLESEDSYIGYKSFFHSFRIAYYGIQIARFGRIIKYDAKNDIWNWIKVAISHNLPLDEIIKNLKPKLNYMMTEFRNVAPKLGNIDV